MRASLLLCNTMFNKILTKFLTKILTKFLGFFFWYLFQFWTKCSRRVTSKDTILYSAIFVYNTFVKWYWGKYQLLLWWLPVRVLFKHLRMPQGCDFMNQQELMFMECQLVSKVSKFPIDWIWYICWIPLRLLLRDSIFILHVIVMKIL